ncbi:condensation domain-containing protein [Salinispora arenicola]|uniref:condensation domain-containing protein n=1 Tax=Salinispora arenicola TaxID=168697 RepID=UPI0016961C4E|nr:condensation domain-containing protein [Salinispora arenicola]NIL64933.1 hypothetical protein [Salinispora arenicola]
MGSPVQLGPDRPARAVPDVPRLPHRGRVDTGHRTAGGAEAYWTARLDALPPGPDLPLRADPGMLDHPPAFDRRSVRLPAGEWAAIKAQAAQRDLTPNAVLLAGYAAVLGRWSRRQHFTLNLPTFNRHPLHEQVNDIIGEFTVGDTAGDSTG